MLMHDLEVLCNEPWCCILYWQFDMQFSYATHLAHPVLCRPTHLNISGYASALPLNFFNSFMTAGQIDWQETDVVNVHTKSLFIWCKKL